MNWIFEIRASTILYNILIGIKNQQYKFFLPANICPIVPATFEKARVDYEFIDISDDTWCINLDVVKNKIEFEDNKIGLLYVRTMGIVDPDTDKIFNLLKQKRSDLLIIDDRCPARIDFSKENLNDSVEATLFSTGYAKYVEMGYGGCATLSGSLSYTSNMLDYEEKDHAKLIASFNESIHRGGKFNYRDSSWLNTHHPEIPFETYKNEVIEKRNVVDEHKSRLNYIYTNELPDFILPKIKDAHHWRFNILVKNKKLLLDSIFEAGLFASSHYASVAHIFKDQTAPVAEKIHAEIVNLFNDYRFSESDAQRICKIVNKHVAKYK